MGVIRDSRMGRRNVVRKIGQIMKCHTHFSDIVEGAPMARGPHFSSIGAIFHTPFF